MTLLAAASLAAQQRPGVNDMRRAAQRGDTAAVRALLKSGISVNAVDEYGMTPLAVAAIQEDEVMIRLLLGAGADPNRVDKTATTALQHAIEWKDINIIRLLLDHGADPNIPDALPVLWVAAQQGSPEIVTLLLERGADPHAREDARDETAREVVERFLEESGHVPLPPDTAARRYAERYRRGLGDVRELLVVAEARFPKGTVRSLLDAAAQGRLSEVRAFLARGAKVDSADRNGRTPLRWAAFRGHTDVVTLLVERGADVNAVDEDGRSVLMTAAWMGRTAAIRVLLRAQAQVDHRTPNGETALMSAIGAREEAPAIVRLLIEHRADVNARSKDGYSALYFADLIGQTECARLLRQAGAR